ncbi:MAG: tetratricopeptide repeat protein [Candidatus Zambryskibacteria bacterium]
MEQNIENAPSVQVSSGLPAQSGNVLAKKLGLIISVFVFLLPVFFVPVSGVSLYVAKITLLATGLVAIFAVFLSSVLSTGTIEIPKVKYLIPIGIFALVSLVSSAFSGAIDSSVAGSIFDLGTSGSILMLVFALFMAVMAIKSVGTMGKIVSAFLYSAIALAVYTLLGIFASPFLPTFIASKMPVFLAGGPIDTAIIFGAVVIFSLCIINMSEISKKMRYILSVLIAFGILFIGAANFRPVVIILGIISMVFFAYILSWSVGRGNVSEETAKGNDRRVSLSSLAVLIASVILLLGGAGVGGYLSKIMKIQTTEIRPNFETTMNLALTSWKQNVAFGIGPNRFAEFWSAHKPVDINQTQFWDADFYSGSGFIPTVAITTGLLGLLSLLAFIGMYVMSGIKAIFAQANASRSRYLATSSFLVSFYLWIMLFLYTPSITVLALAFIFTGLFTATLVPQGIIGTWKINIFSNPKTNFLSVLSIIVLLIVSVAGGYFVWERTVATVVFERGVSEYQRTGNIQLARESTTKAINMVSSDIYWRGLAEISLIDLGRVLGGITNQNQITDAVRTEIQGLIANAVESAKKATEIDGNNFRNWFALARVYEVLASNGIQGSLESARNAYTEAALRSPSNPAVPLALARLDALEGKIDDARMNITKALELKNNYTDAYFTLAQLEVGANNIPGAVRSVEAATIIDPGNSGLYFQLGLLKYNQRDFAGAAGALEKAIGLVPDYANAKYFLGLSYYQVGRKEDAIKQFEEISATNPDNQEVKAILSDMKTGKSPFADAQATGGSKPPVEEN